MGWKTTVKITREQAINLILSARSRKPYDKKTNEELEQLLYENDYGDNPKLSHFGHNFIVVDKVEEKVTKV